ncbi:antitoxin Xre/MbcA/ParS toxin-binding domain-containing protein [Devosia sp.]|uniref:antitoxin Xre/MbcA/ParS toxin-binding domain-containing protein n=1 Tax=Devosia sp. TaxID=1871048 RepID=UPI0019E7E7E1|nr:antitoxin Xre/MbcA/ParS toxin-binding domain-containing protein [Devosia sp.]MBE0581896.1 DUF2384 domain-containing protein [Devosia sp.]
MTVNPELTRLSEQLGLRPSELAKLAGLVPSSLRSKCKARELDATLTPIARILATATEMAGDESRAAIWFKHQPIAGWSGKTAYDLVGEGKSDDVLAYLEAVRAGVHA